MRVVVAQAASRGAQDQDRQTHGVKENPKALQGFHAEHLLFLIDEASGDSCGAIKLPANRFGRRRGPTVPDV